MKIMDKKVMHKRFGMGSVIGLKDNKIYVSCLLYTSGHPAESWYVDYRGKKMAA